MGPQHRRSKMHTFWEILKKVIYNLSESWVYCIFCKWINNTHTCPLPSLCMEVISAYNSAPRYYRRRSSERNKKFFVWILPIWIFVTRRKTNTNISIVFCIDPSVSKEIHFMWITHCTSPLHLLCCSRRPFRLSSWNNTIQHKTEYITLIFYVYLTSFGRVNISCITARVVH